jgi:hypothetical protein
MREHSHLFCSCVVEGVRASLCSQEHLGLGWEGEVSVDPAPQLAGQGVLFWAEGLVLTLLHQ